MSKGDIIVFDIETNGLYHDVDTVWGIGLSDTVDLRVFERDIPKALEQLSKAKIIVGHNIIGYDLPVLRKLFKWEPSPDTQVFDTLVASRLIYTDIKRMDSKSKKFDMPGDLVKRPHSIAAWGVRFGLGKLESPLWEYYTPEMEPYCIRDLEICEKLYWHVMKQGYSQEALDLEHEFAKIISRQICYGVGFNVELAKQRYVELHQRRDELAKELKGMFSGWFKRGKEFTPKRPNKTMGYTAGGTLTKIEWVDFNPRSRDHIAHVLRRDYNWKPRNWTPGGKPEVSEKVLEHFKDWKGVPEIIELLTVGKILGFLGDGDQSWLKHERNGRMHGSVNTNGAVTGRCTHSNPNLGNVPTRSELGGLCRELFYAPGPIRVLMGCDASGLELRALGGYMAHWDGGTYAKAAVEGRKEDGTDPHSIHAAALGIIRDVAKTWFYAFIYGAGDGKLGEILKGTTRKGKESRAKLQSKVPALGKLIRAVQKAAKRKGYLVGLDGRHLHVRGLHSALNTLLQSAGAVLMKRALVIQDGLMQSHGFKPWGEDYEFVLNVHDEWQMECANEAVAKHAGTLSLLALKKAGEYYEFKCPIEGEYSIGKTWRETH